ncbi:MAG: TolC family protein [Verrucomicrobia bacterium]|nr:TolC family protein [Verrucomicrobiota bacterium]MBV9657468.1 TolC family protein [Verrucomicrobiota bacterium]
MTRLDPRIHSPRRSHSPVRWRCAVGLLTSASLLFTQIVALPLRAGPTTVVERRPPPIDDALRAQLKNLTLDRAISIAVQRNPDILRQLQEIQRYKGLYLEARADALPHLVFTGTFTETDRRLLTAGSSASLASGGASTLGNGTLIDSTGQPLTTSTGQVFNLAQLFSGGSGISIPDKNYQIQLQATQFVFTSGRVTHQIRGAQFGEGAQYFALRETVDTTVLNVRTGFYQVLLNEALIKIQEQSVRLLEGQLKDQQNRFAAGTVPRFNVLQAEVALANQQPQLITARNNFALSKLQLARLIGIDSPPDNGRIADFNCVGTLAYAPRDFNVEESVRAAILNRSLLKQRRLETLASNENIKVALAGFGPTVQANAGIEQRNQTRSNDIGDSVGGWFFGATATWNIFDGLATYGRYKEQRALRNEALVAYDDAVRLVTTNVQNAILNVRQSKELIASQQLNVSEAEEAVRLAQARLSAGAGTQLDVLNAQTQLLQAQTTELQARFSYVSNIATYEQATGTSTVYQDNFVDPVTHAKFGAPVPTAGRTTVTVSKGDTPSSAIRSQSDERRATGRPVTPPAQKANAETAGERRPPVTHNLNLPLGTADAPPNASTTAPRDGSARDNLNKVMREVHD